MTFVFDEIDNRDRPTFPNLASLSERATRFIALPDFQRFVCPIRGKLGRGPAGRAAPSWWKQMCSERPRLRQLP
ncbi:MAG: hypothetical protein M3133_10880 [Actinomycetota bacterium]|nr:hypothetical protein [Actinomycetota bacterium]